MDRPPVFDPAMALERAGCDEMLRRIIGKFMGDAAGKLERLRSELERGDLGAARLEVHNLNGLAGYVGGERFRLAAVAVEKAIREENLPAARLAHEELPSELAVLQGHLKEYMAAGGGLHGG